MTDDTESDSHKMIEDRHLPSRMEIAAWAILGVLPAAVLTKGRYDPWFLIAHLFPAFSLSVACCRLNDSWQMLSKTVLVLLGVHIVLSPLLGNIFILDPRHNRPVTLHLLPVLFSGMNPAPGNSALRIFVGCLTWSAIMGGVARMFLDIQNLRAHAKACVRGCVVFGRLLLLHLYVVPNKVYWWDSPTEKYIGLKTAAGVYTLLAASIGFQLALFHDLFRPKQQVTR